MISKYFFFFLAFCFISCSPNDNGAQSRLNLAREYYKNNKFDLATREIDSIKILYPKAIDERRAGLALLDSVRRRENKQIIYFCDSLIAIFQPKIDIEKKKFIYQQNKEYQETGSYIPKEQFSDRITSTLLRSGITQSGELYLESVFVGTQRHDKIKVSTKDGSFAETLPVRADGLNYRFSNMGKEYEVIRFSGTDENGVAQFIFSNSAELLTVTIEGSGKFSYILPQSTKSSISKSYELSTMMIQMDSLRTEKEKAEFRLYNLDNKH